MNSLGIDLHDKDVLIRADALKPEYADRASRRFHVTGGFGASSYTMGTALIGEFVADGEHARMDGTDVEALWSEEVKEDDRTERDELRPARIQDRTGQQRTDDP